MPAPLSPEEIKRRIAESQARAAEARAKALASFPFERVDVPGDMALAKWEELRKSGRGVPFVIGNEESVAAVGEPLGEHWPYKRSLADILAAADRLHHPADLFALRTRESAEAAVHLKQMLEKDPNAPLPHMSVVDAEGRHRDLTPEEARAAFLQSLDHKPPTGDWPSESQLGPPGPEPSVAFDIITMQPLQKAHIALVPTDDWTTIPAHLNWGGWNACPAPEYHVAALRSWRDRYGAELVGLSRDTMNLRVARSPATRAEAMDLAHEQYAYCNDIVDQGVGTMSMLAAALMASPWWYFWWD